MTHEYSVQRCKPLMQLVIAMLIRRNNDELVSEELSLQVKNDFVLALIAVIESLVRNHYASRDDLKLIHIPLTWVISKCHEAAKEGQPPHWVVTILKESFEQLNENASLRIKLS